MTKFIARHDAAERSRPVPLKIAHRQLLSMLLGITIFLIAIFALQTTAAEEVSAGDPLRQIAAILGSILLCLPVIFTLSKRAGLSRSPPTWFVVHVAGSAVGFLLVSFHVSGGSLISAPGVVYGLAFFLVYQGVVARVFISRKFSHQFGSRETSFHIADLSATSSLMAVIEEKRVVLARLDPAAREATFSPNARHLLRRPWLTLRYARLVARESRLVGARRKAGLALSLWRRFHILAAILLYIGILTHTAMVTFFAGYVAGDRGISWGHLATLGA